MGERSFFTIFLTACRRAYISILERFLYEIKLLETLGLCGCLRSNFSCSSECVRRFYPAMNLTGFFNYLPMVFELAMVCCNNKMENLKVKFGSVFQKQASKVSTLLFTHNI